MVKAASYFIQRCLNFSSQWVVNVILYCEKIVVPHIVSPVSITGLVSFSGWGFLWEFSSTVRQMLGKLRPHPSPSIIGHHFTFFICYLSFPNVGLTPPPRYLQPKCPWVRCLYKEHGLWTRTLDRNKDGPAWNIWSAECQGHLQRRHKGHNQCQDIN